MFGFHLELTAQETPEALAVVAGELNLTYGELYRLGVAASEQLAALGTQPGDVVACALPICPEAVVLFAACAHRGAVFLAVNPGWTADEIAWLSREVPLSAAFVANPEAWNQAGFPASRLFSRNDISLTPALLLQKPPAAIRDLPDHHPISYQLSSGSTGRPKIVSKSANQFFLSRQQLAGAVDLQPGQRILVTAPFYFGFSISWNLLLPVVRQATMVLVEDFHPAAAATVLAHHKIQCLWGSPVLYGLLLDDSSVRPSDLQSLEICLSGGAPMAATIKARWKEKTGIGIRQAYGTTEAGIIAVQREAVLPDGCVGHAVPGAELRVFSEDRDSDEEMPAGTPGEIAIRGPGVMLGYLNDPEAAEALRQGEFLRTGDRGWLDESGRLFLAGRIQPWINSGGIKVDPAEVARVLRQLPGVQDCRVSGEPGPRGREIVAADFVLAPGVQLTRPDIMRHCREHLAPAKIPRIIRLHDAASLDLTGKLRRPPAPA